MFFSSSKGQGMSLKVIIVAVIALVILVVLIISFTGKYRVFGKTTESCSVKGGQCKASCSAGEMNYPNTDCKKQYPEPQGKLGPNCCVPFFEEQKKAEDDSGESKSKDQEETEKEGD